MTKNLMTLSLAMLVFLPGESAFNYHGRAIAREVTKTAGSIEIEGHVTPKGYIVNAREKPSLDSKIKFRLKKGTFYSYSHRKGDWYCKF